MAIGTRSGSVSTIADDQHTVFHQLGLVRRAVRSQCPSRTLCPAIPGRSLYRISTGRRCTCQQTTPTSRPCYPGRTTRSAATSAPTLSARTADSPDRVEISGTAGATATPVATIGAASTATPIASRPTAAAGSK